MDTVLALLAACDAAPVVSSRPPWLSPANNCTADGECCGVSCTNCCTGKSHLTGKCGQGMQCALCKAAFAGLVKALMKVPDCSKLNFPDICKALPQPIPGVTVICPGLLYGACDWVLKKIQSGVKDPATLCAQFGACGSIGSRCGCLPDGACNKKDAAGCCNGTMHHVLSATCASETRCGCRNDGECVAITGGSSDCCSGKLHHTAACAGGKRCGCLPDGACLSPTGGAMNDCCAGVGHWTIKCAGFRTCGPKLDDNAPDLSDWVGDPEVLREQT